MTLEPTQASDGFFTSRSSQIFASFQSRVTVSAEIVQGRLDQIEGIPEFESEARQLEVLAASYKAKSKRRRG
jgi:hypothetical protein